MVKAKYLFLIKGRNFSENKMLGISDNKSKLVPSIAVLPATVPASSQRIDLHRHYFIVELGPALNLDTKFLILTYMLERSSNYLSIYPKHSWLRF